MSTLIQIKNIWRAITNLKRRVDCACSKATVPPLPTENGTYYLVILNGIATWESQV